MHFPNMSYIWTKIPLNLGNVLMFWTFLCWEKKITYMAYIGLSSCWVNEAFKHFFFNWWVFSFLIMNEWDFLEVLGLGILIFSYLFRGPCEIVCPGILIQTNNNLHTDFKLKFIFIIRPIYLPLKFPLPQSLSQSVAEYGYIRLAIQILCLVSSLDHFW